MGVVVTELQYVSDIAEPYDVVIVGADKWNQLLDVRFHPTPEAHDGGPGQAAHAARRARGRPWPVPDEHRLDVPDAPRPRSAPPRSAQGRKDWMAPEAREIGAWD